MRHEPRKWDKFLVMKLKEHLLIISFIVVSSTTLTFGQKKICNSRCEALKVFLNSQEVNKWFAKRNLKDSDLIIVDVRNNLEQCLITKWRGFKVSILKSGPLHDSLAKFNPYYVLKGRSKYYVLLSNKRNGIITYFIHQGSSSYACEVKVFKRNNKFILSKIETVTL